ncbi:MAG: methyltransferase domain-containing protein [Terracidiphilus sp.]
MPHSTLDFRERAQLTELMDLPCSREVLRSYLRSLARTNRWTFAHRPLLGWLESFRIGMTGLGEPVRILDVGCGYGDGLRRIERWADLRGIAVELTGLDLNADTAAVAAEASPPTSRIRWLGGDVFAYAPPQPVHLVVSSLFTHHLSEDEIVRFLQWMERNAQLGWFINDLSRGAISYHFFRVFSKLARFHPYVQHDGPISIARAFVLEDWRRMCTDAGFDDNSVQVKSYRPGRLCVARRKPQ